MDPFFDGTGKTGTAQVSFTRTENVSERFHFLSEPFHFFRSCVYQIVALLERALSQKSYLFFWGSGIR